MIRHATAAALAILSLCACKGDADFNDAMPAPVTLNADEYRREISAIALQETFEAFERNLNALASRLALTIPMVCIEARK